MFLPNFFYQKSIFIIYYCHRQIIGIHIFSLRVCKHFLAPILYNEQYQNIQEPRFFALVMVATPLARINKPSYTTLYLHLAYQINSKHSLCYSFAVLCWPIVKMCDKITPSYCCKQPNDLRHCDEICTEITLWRRF